jgi:phage tail-like protein
LEYGTLYAKTLSGGFEFVAPNKLRISNLVPDAEWIGYWLGATGSCYPQNNVYFKIAEVDAANKEITLTVDKPIKDDTGVDADSDGNIVRNRVLRGVITSYKLAADPDSETDAVTCAYAPVVTEIREPQSIEIPLSADSRQYSIITLHDDISIGRCYTIHLAKVKNEYDIEAEDTSIYEFVSDTFGSPADRIKLWDFMPELDKQEDTEAEQQLQKMAVVLQDLLNVLWHRSDSIKYLYDPDNAPDSWIPYLLYTLGNPFRMPLDILQQRRLCSVLSAIYKQVGTAKIIEDTLTFFLGGTFIVQTYQTANWWTLNTSVLGTTTVLGPSTKYGKNAYEIISSRALTEDERRYVTHIARTLDPLYMHLIRIVEPGDTSGTLTYWTLSMSGLGYGSELAP